MKKSYFMKVYNMVQFLVLLLFLTTAFSAMLEILTVTCQNIDKTFPYINQIINGIQRTSQTVSLINTVLPIVLIILALPEVIKRIPNDSLLNLGKSIVGTYQFRRFLKQHQNNSKDDLNTETQSINMTISSFNKSVNKCVLNVSNDKLELLIKVPKEAQSQIILKQNEEQIKEHIASLYPEYIISTFERNKYNLWLIGTKK